MAGPYGQVGIEFKNLGRVLRTRIGSVLAANGVAYSAGRRAYDVLRLASNVADTETVVIGADTYEIETVATAIGGGVTASGGDLNNTTDPVQVTIAAHGLVAGDPIACQSEIMTVLHVVDANEVVVARGRFGTTAATHADGQTINKGNGITAGRIPVGFIGTFTPAVAGPALAAAINNAVCANGERPTGKVSTIFASVSAVSLASGAEVLVQRTTVGVNTTAVSETLAGANNAWNAAAFYGGEAAGDKRVFRVAYVPTAQDVAIGNIRIPVEFTPVTINVFIVVTATGVPLAWNGGVLYSSGILTLDNTGTTDWAATNTIYIELVG